MWLLNITPAGLVDSQTTPVISGIPSQAYSLDFGAGWCVFRKCDGTAATVFAADFRFYETVASCLNGVIIIWLDMSFPGRIGVNELTTGTGTHTTAPSAPATPSAAAQGPIGAPPCSAPSAIGPTTTDATTTGSAPCEGIPDTWRLKPKYRSRSKPVSCIPAQEWRRWWEFSSCGSVNRGDHKPNNDNQNSANHGFYYESFTGPQRFFPS